MRLDAYEFESKAKHIHQFMFLKAHELLVKILTRKLYLFVFLSILLMGIFYQVQHNSFKDLKLPPPDWVSDSPTPDLLLLNKNTTSGLQRLFNLELISSSNEKQLIDILNHVQQGQLSQATTLTQELISDSPQYALAHALYADLLHMQLIGLQEESSLTGLTSIQPNTKTRLKAIETELNFRLIAQQQHPKAYNYPQNIQSIDPHYHKLVVADTLLGRVYIYDIKHENRRASFHLKYSLFMTIGVNGTGKEVEGDQKTPLGAYFLLPRVLQHTLPDLYGTGAFPINYPNPVDRFVGKTGSGIWFHGSPSSVYVREPFASDGCLVLSNPDMTTFNRLVSPSHTIVIIDDGIKRSDSNTLTFDDSNDSSPVYNNVVQLKKSLEQGDTDAALRHYHGNFKHRPLIEAVRQNGGRIRAMLHINDPLTIINWNKSDPYTIVEFNATLPHRAMTERIRQYWMPMDGKWKIISETIH